MRKIAESIIFLLLCINIILILIPQKQNKFQKIKAKEITLNASLENVQYQVGTTYISDEINATIDGVNCDEDVIKTTTGLTSIGKKYISYKLPINEFYTEEKYDEIEVVDKVTPNIYLKGGQTVLLQVGEVYNEPGYYAIDAYEGDLTDKVEVTGSVDYNNIGEYKINYQVQDSFGNKSTTSRTIIVKAEVKEEKEDENEVFHETNYKQTVVNSIFHNKGFSLSFYVKDDDAEIKINNKNVSVNKERDNYYRLIVDISNYKNGNYQITLNDEPLKDERKLLNKISRAKIGDKLVTMSYENNEVSFKIEDFEYEYDVLIDAGHGGSDPGASNGKYVEKNINLEQTLYEKKRFEDHGLKVKLIRDDDSYGIMMGEDDWKLVSRRAYTIGYYSVVSKIAYSNHHNNFGTNKYTGFEILVPASLTLNELSTEYNLYEAWMKIYPLGDDHIRFYGRNYDTEIISNKINGEVYTFVDYYAVNRVPLVLFHEKVPIYEGSYMSNENDFNWYYEQGNWKKLSEEKIRIYVESLGITYRGVSDESK